MINSKTSNIKIFASIICLTFLFSGCSFNRLEPNNLMKPPRLGGDIGKVQMEIEKTYGEDILFKYPKSGKYRSSIIFHDIDGDGNEEAIALFKTNSMEKCIYVQIYYNTMTMSDKTNWYKVNEFTVEYDNVDRVYFEDIDGDGKDEIIIGWSDNSNADHNHITAYDCEYSRGVCKIINVSEPYMDMALMDVDEDNIKEIFIIQSQPNSNYTSSVKLLKLNTKGGPYKIETLDEIGLDLLDLENIHITQGMLDNSKYGISIDSQSNYNKQTDIIYWDTVQKKLRNPIKEHNSYINISYFPSDIKIYPRDVNNDGIIEFPVISQVYSSENKSTETSTPYLLNWKSYGIETGKFNSVRSLIYNNSEKYTLDTQDKWKEENTDINYSKVSVLIDEENRTMTISTQAEGDSLFTITTFSEKEWQLKKNSKFVEIYKGDGLVYAITQINLDNELSITEEEIINSFEKVNNNWEDI